MSAKKANLNLDETKTVIKYIVKNNRYLQESGKVPVTINIEGGAGIGKTSAVRQLANELGINCVRINLAEIEELGDLVGFPVRQFELCKQGTTVLISAPVIMEVPQTIIKARQVPRMVKKIIEEPKVIKKQVMGTDGKLIMKDVTTIVKVEREVEEMFEEEYEETVLIKQEVPAVADSHTGTEGECIWVDEQAIHEYTKNGYIFTGKKRMSYCPPEWITGLDDRGGFLLIDDYSRADQRFLQATMTLIETQKYISWALPKDWHILLTTNPDNGEYLVTTMDIAQKTRFITIDVKFDVQIWAQWAEKEKIDGRCINFLLLHPELVTESCNARAITTFFNSISSIEDFSKDLGIIQMIGEGSVGAEFSTMFVLFINNRLDKLVSPKDILLGENEKSVLDDLQICIGKDATYRADIASILTTRLINFTLNYANDHTISPKTSARLIKLSTEDILTDDLKYILVKKLLNGNKQKFQKLMADPEVMKMAMK